MSKQAAWVKPELPTGRVDRSAGRAHRCVMTDDFVSIGDHAAELLRKLREKLNGR